MLVEELEAKGFVETSSIIVCERSRACSKSLQVINQLMSKGSQKTFFKITSSSLKEPVFISHFVDALKKYKEV